MQDGVLNLCRVKLRDQQRLAHGPLTEYPQYPDGTFGEAVPRAGNATHTVVSRRASLDSPSGCRSPRPRRRSRSRKPRPLAGSPPRTR